MMFGSAMFFSGLGLLWPMLGLLALALGLLVRNYWEPQGGASRWGCLGLKLLGFAALATCLLEPFWSAQRVRPGANLFAIVADNSQGLQVRDAGETRTRGETLRELLDPLRERWQGTLEENFELRRYYFDARLQSTRDFNDLSFDGRASAIGYALRSVAERFRNRPLAGVLLLTDGNATDLHGVPSLSGLPPVYPVVIGRPGLIKDLAIQQAHATQTDFEDAPVAVQADVTANGYNGRQIVAQLQDSTGKKVAEQTLTPRKDNDLLAFRFQLRPEKPGLSFYTVRVRAKSELANANGDRSEEATLANNATVLAVNRGNGPYRILYVSGRPNWEFKFLNRALQEDNQLQLVGLIRVARREPRFNFIGRAGETSNPLFRGFGNQSPEEVEQYNQPVLVRLNTQDKLELRGGFPRTAEELYSYHAVIVGDLEAEFFTPDQSALLQKFVSERGGGFLMLGGMESFQQGKYERTPIGDMLPIYLDRTPAMPPPGPLHLNLTREGLLHSWARLRDNEADEKSRLEQMPALQVMNPFRDIKPGATVIVTAATEDGHSYPALAVQRFGHGRTAALAFGDVWRWGLHDAASHKDMDKAWRQLARWLVSDTPNRVELTAEPQPDDPNGAMRLQVRARDQKFQPLDNASVHLEVRPAFSAPGGTNSIRLQVEPATSEPGVYQATYAPRATGGYLAEVTVTNAEGIKVGQAAAGWNTDLAADEFRSLTPNVALLETIARQTGGELIRPEDLERFAHHLPNRHAPVMDAWNFPLWHTPAMFGFALACLISEWGLRRWKGLP